MEIPFDPSTLSPFLLNCSYHFCYIRENGYKELCLNQTSNGTRTFYPGVNALEKKMIFFGHLLRSAFVTHLEAGMEYLVCLGH
jgi:hypothetical protein